MNRYLQITALAACAGFAFGAPQTHAAKETIILGMALEPPHLDPTAGAAAAIDEIVYANIFEGLTRINRNGEVKPALAESWDLSGDGTVYTFKLREGVKFHDGSIFDAEDVKFSLDRARADDSTNAQKGLFAPIESVEVVDSATVRVTLSSPAGNFLFNMGWGDAVIVASETADTNKENPIGTGPFKFDDWAQGSSIEIVRNEDYWGEPVALTSATFRFIPDASAAIAALQSGDVDGFPNFPAPEAIPAFEADDRFAVVIGSTEGETILSTNNTRAPFDKLEVRQAIAHTLDRQAVIDGAMFGVGTPIGTHFAPHHPAYVAETINTYPHDPEKARALLAEAGFPDGFEATLHLPPPTYARRGGEIIASQLREIGIELEIIPVEWKQWLEGPFKGDFDLTIVSHTEPMDINIYANPDYYFHYDSSEFQSVMEKLNVTIDTEARYALYGEAQRIISRDAVNGYIFELAKTGVWNANIEGLWENAPVQANDLTEVKWTQ
jgi:peptide/nickel transport system substrate-binding protein